MSSNYSDGPALCSLGTGTVQRHLPGSRLLNDAAWNGVARRLQLSTRELEVIRGVFDDRTEFAIATGLDISPHTVHTHFKRLHKKLGTTNRVQLVLRVMSQLIPRGAESRPQLPSEKYY
jgi:DNA-binding CsgD family transcriptional regulator